MKFSYETCVWTVFMYARTPTKYSLAVHSLHAEEEEQKNKSHKNRPCSVPCTALQCRLRVCVRLTFFLSQFNCSKNFYWRISLTIRLHWFHIFFCPVAFIYYIFFLFCQIISHTSQKWYATLCVCVFCWLKRARLSFVFYSCSVFQFAIFFRSAF